MSLVTRKKVLVLNRSWVACSIITLRRAIALIFKEDAFIVDPVNQYQKYTWDEWKVVKPCEGEEFISSAHDFFRIPEVVLLRHYDKPPVQRINFSRRALHRRDGNRCCYCGLQGKTDELTVDHVLPRSQGGKTSWENCVIACAECNSRKAGRTPSEANMKFYQNDYKPFKPKYSLHFGNAYVKSWEYFIPN